MSEPRALSPVGMSSAEREVENLQKKYVGNTQEEIESAFWRNLAEAGMTVEAGAHSGGGASEDDAGGDGPRPASRYEKAILEISGLRDELVSVCSSVGNGPGADAIKKAIGRIERVVRSLGGEIEPVNELAYMSSLSKAASSDDIQAILANANKVVENTKARYVGNFRIGKTLVKMAEGRPTILIRFEGEDRNKPFIAYGQIIADTDFTGNEAIDFVRKNGDQQFFVKAVRLGSWVDLSEDFSISMTSETPKAPQTAPPAPVVAASAAPRQATGNSSAELIAAPVAKL